MPHLWRHLLASLCAVILAGPAAVAESGFAEFSRDDPATGDRLPVALWYPTDAEAAELVRGPFRFQAAEGAPPRRGPHPLVVFSHGSASSPFTHAHTAVALAKAGYVVAAPMHRADNFLDASGAGTREVLADRAHSLSAVIDRLTAPNPLGLEIDAGGIAAAGFSAGGATALALAGARPSMAAAVAHCATRDDPFCAFVPAGDARFDDDRPIDGLHDGRVRALILLSPVTAYFDDGEVAAIDLPMMVLVAGLDKDLSPERNSERLLRLQGASAERFDAPLAGHYSVLPVFGDPLPEGVPPAFAEDAAGFDRAAFLDALHSGMITFLDAALSD